MNTQLSFRTLARTYGLWACALAIPLIANWAVWAFVVVPQRAQVAAWLDAQLLAKSKPRLEALLDKSRKTLIDWQRKSFTADDPAAVMQTLKRLADRHRVEVQELSAGQSRGEVTSSKAVAGFSTVPIKLAVSGRFHKLAHWLSDVESHSGLQVESWSIEPGESPGDPHQLTVDITAFLRGAS